MILAHRIALDPTEKQSNQLARAAGVARFTFNWGLAEWRRQYEAGQKPNAFALKKQFNAIRHEQFPWSAEVTKCALEGAFANLGKAFANFFRRLKQKQGKPGFPKFKRRGRHDAFGVANDKFRFDGRRVRLPKIGWVRTREELRFGGKILGGTVSRSAGRWFLSVQVDCGANEAPPHAGPVVGVDLGLKTFATIHDGVTSEKIDAPKPLAQAQRRLRQANRRLARRVQPGKPASARCRLARDRVARLHRRVRNIRADFLHKLTTELAKTKSTVVVEDLCVSGMVKLKSLARAVSDAGFAEFRRQLAYKAPLHGSQLVVVDRWFPSSKTCSACGSVKDSLALAERVFACHACNAVLDRDENAALNIRTAGLAGTGRRKPSNARGPEGSGVVVHHHAKPCRAEPRTTPGDAHVLTQ